MPNDTTIIVTRLDAEKFKLFMQHYDTFSLFLERGVFDQKNASVVLNFDQHGSLSSIQRQDFLFSTREKK